MGFEVVLGEGDAEGRVGGEVEGGVAFAPVSIVEGTVSLRIVGEEKRELVSECC